MMKRKETMTKFRDDIRLSIYCNFLSTLLFIWEASRWYCHDEFFPPHHNYGDFDSLKMNFTRTNDFLEELPVLYLMFCAASCEIK